MVAIARIAVVALMLTVACAGTAAAGDLALSRVILSSGGVGYFEYAAKVEGDATLGLDVPLDQVDDILKSLVVFDSAGGVAGVELPGRDSTVQAFGAAPFGPEALDSPLAYLNALRGTEVTVQGPRPITGRIVRAEAVTETAERLSLPRTRVSLLCADGLRQFVLEDADSVQVTDPALRGKIDRALQALRGNAGQSTRHLAIRLKGGAKRSVAVGYVTGAPLWKATYRLVLGADGAARLQGWATLENQSGADWKSVGLTLQYGNPVAFRQALYRSYFVQRPEVPVEILGRLLPDIDTRARDFPVAAAFAPAAAAPAAAAVPLQMAAPAEAAAADETADETIFTLARPVDLAAGHSLNVPILDSKVSAPRIGLVPFRQAYPLAAVRLTSADPRSLPAGVVTVYDSASGDTSFAGDARLGGLPAGETRLLAFARDLRTTVETRQSPQPDFIVGFTAANGVLTYTLRQRTAVRITVAAPLHEARDLLLELPKRGPEQTVSFADGTAAVTEQTATAFRVAVSLKPGETRTIEAWLDAPARRTIALADGDTGMLRLIVDTDRLDPAGRAALRRILDLRNDEAIKASEVDRLHKTLQDVLADEDRLRKNLGAVSATDSLRTRLTRDLDADETKIDALRVSIASATTELDAARRVLTEAIAALRA